MRHLLRAGVQSSCEGASSTRRSLPLLTLAAAVALFALSVVMPAHGGPFASRSSSALATAEKALKLAKAADQRARRALKLSATPGPAGPQGPQGPAGEDGRDGSDGADGAKGTDGADGAPGAPGAALRTHATGAGPVPTGDEAPVDYPLSNSSWTALQGETDLVMGFASYQSPAACSGANAGLRVILTVNGSGFVGSTFVRWPGNEGEFFLPLQMLPVLNLAAGQQTLTARIHDTCAEKHQEFRVTSMVIDVGAFVK